MSGLNVSQIAKAYAVHKNTVSSWIDSGELPAVDVRQSGGKFAKWRVSQDDLILFMRARGNKNVIRTSEFPMLYDSIAVLNILITKYKKSLSPSTKSWRLNYVRQRIRQLQDRIDSLREKPKPVSSEPIVVEFDESDEKKIAKYNNTVGD